MNGVTPNALARDLMAGVVVFLVALPLCLGIAVASGAPPLSGIVAGIVGGIVVGLLSGSHTSVSGPAAGLSAVVAAQISQFGTFEAFLLAVFLAGLIQIGLGLAQAGFLADFVPSSVIKGLLAAIGVILILKQAPYVLGRHPDAEEMNLFRLGWVNATTEWTRAAGEFHPGAAAIGLMSIAITLLWERIAYLKKMPLPAPLIVVLAGVGGVELLRLAGFWPTGRGYLMELPVPKDWGAVFALARTPDFTAWRDASLYASAVTLAAVGSLETLLNLEAADRLDPQQRSSPSSRELVAQGVGNAVSGLLGGLPVTSVVVRSSVNIAAGARTRRSAIFHGALLLASVSLLGTWLNRIPMAALAAILVATGLKLASPRLALGMWRQGRSQFAPFIVTVGAIVLTDVLRGVVLGMLVSVGFVLWSSARRPIRRIVERHLAGDVERIELANQVSFLNRAALAQALDRVPAEGRILLDARATDYIDPDVLDLIKDFVETTGPARNVGVSLLGFRSRYQLDDQILYADYTTRELQETLTPAQVLRALKDGNDRFRAGRRLMRDLDWPDPATTGQHPLAVIVGCIDSRTPAEIVFDLSVGDIFSVRVAGNVVSRDILGSIEYACEVAGAKLVLVMGHTRCGAVQAAVQRLSSEEPNSPPGGCQHLDDILAEITKSIQPRTDGGGGLGTPAPHELENVVTRRNVLRSVARIQHESPSLARLVQRGSVAVVGSVYDVSSRTIEFLDEAG